MPPNVLLLVMDAVRVHNCGCYTEGCESTPFLSSLSKNASLYTQARSPGCHTPASHASMFTGFEVDEHEIRGSEDKLTPGHSIWEWLKTEHEYPLGMFSTNAFLNSNIRGLIHGFDFVTGNHLRQYINGLHPADIAYDSPDNDYIQYLKACLKHEHPILSVINGIDVLCDRNNLGATSDAVIEQFLAWEQLQSEPWGACINMTDAHFPYQPISEDSDPKLMTIQENIEHLAFECYCGNERWKDLSSLEALYTGAIKSIDKAISKLIYSLKQRERYEDTFIVITSDHGEGFGEQSRVENDLRMAAHKGGIHETLFHVPLIVKHPQQHTGIRYDSLSSPIQFPEVVRKVVAEESGLGEFRRQNLRISSKNPRGQGEIDLATEHCSEYDFIHRYKRGLYEQMNGKIIKQMTSDSPDGTHAAEQTIRIISGEIQRTSADSRSIVDDAFSDISSAGIRSSTDEVSSRTLQRLEDLGYR